MQHTDDLTNAAALVERARLVRLCARLTGNVDSAEDLAHETLVVALRNETTLRDSTRRPQSCWNRAQRLPALGASSRPRDRGVGRGSVG